MAAREDNIDTAAQALAAIAAALRAADADAPRPAVVIQSLVKARATSPQDDPAERVLKSVEAALVGLGGDDRSDLPHAADPDLTSEEILASIRSLDPRDSTLIGPKIRLRRGGFDNGGALMSFAGFASAAFMIIGFFATVLLGKSAGIGGFLGAITTGVALSIAFRERFRLPPSFGA